MTMDRGASPSDTDLDLAVDLAGIVGLERFRGGRVHDLAGLHVELAPMTLALDRRAVDLASHREVAVAVGADVAERVELAVHPGDRDLRAAHVEGLRLPFRDLVRIADRHELRHVETSLSPHS